MAPACSVRIATNGSAIRVTKLPKTEIVAAVHTRTNAPLRHSPGVGTMSCVGGVGSRRGSAVTDARVPAADRGGPVVRGRLRPSGQGRRPGP